MRTNSEIAKALVAAARTAGLEEHEIEEWTYPERKIAEYAEGRDVRSDLDAIRDLVTGLVS